MSNRKTPNSTKRPVQQNIQKRNIFLVKQILLFGEMLKFLFVRFDFLLFLGHFFVPTPGI